MIDPELEAIFKCTEVLKDLDNESKVRVIQYLLSRFKLATGSGTHSATNDNNSSQNNNPTLLEQNRNSTDSPVKTTTPSYPVIKDIVTKDLPKSEIEWILVYAFYAAEYAENSFTREDIIAYYEKSNRKSQQRIGNLTLNINSAVKKDWIKAINDNDYIVCDEGKKHMMEVLNGNSATKQRKTTKRPVKKQTSGPLHPETVGTEENVEV